eukprot:SAG22_NODE_591_length_8819_cov_3.667737_6_plen_354_part_00
MMRLGIGLHDAPHSGGGGMLHCNREAQRSSTVGSPSMAAYSVVDGKPFMTDFGMFVYLDTVQPGDGGLVMLHGSHKSSFERPPSVGGTYGSGNWGVDNLGVREKGFTPDPHPCGCDDYLPPGCVNPCPRAGDIVFMSECVCHSNMAWNGSGHRHVLRIGFKPQHVAFPEECFTDEQILRLPPEIRELRSHAPLGHVKKIAEPGRGPVQISAPAQPPAPVTDDERTPGQPHHIAGPGDAEILQSLPARDAPRLPPIPGGMTDVQRYNFDRLGYCKLEAAITGDELARCRQAALDYINTPTRGLPAGFKQTPGGKYLHAHAWAPCLEDLATHPAIFPVSANKRKLVLLRLWVGVF